MLRMKHFIDSHKGATPIAVLGLIWYHQRWDNATAWVYLGLHGTYGVLWVLKSAIFGDRNWEAKTTLPAGLGIWGGLTLYWIAPWLITSRDLRAPTWLLGAAVAVYALGVFFHFTSDMQKHATLAIRPGLITTGLFARCRNPNYFGELLIYLGFGVLAMHWLPLTILGVFVVGYWIPQMRRKDRSLSRYPEFADYARRSTLFIPYVL